MMIIVNTAMTMPSRISIGEYSPKPTARGKGPMKTMKALLPETFASRRRAEKSIVKPVRISIKPVKNRALNLFKTGQTVEKYC